MLSITRCLVLALLFSAAVVVADDEPEVELEVAAEEPEPEFDTFSPEERAKIEESQETHEFQAEVSRLMDILINSLYSNREIFIRELISNAADALDKVRFLSLTDGTDTGELGIKVSFDKNLKTITITDQGVGMTKDDLMKNLGIIAKSGTTDFLDAAAKSADSMNLIGQFGVGFYSVYLVAEKVTVVSKNAKDDQYIWESAADSVFTVTKDPRGNTLGRGTSIILHLKEDAEEFMSEELMTSLITRYSQFINFPISLLTTTEIEVEDEVVEVEAEETEAEETEEEDDEDVDVSEEEEEDAAEPTFHKETVEEWKVLNEAKSIWTKNPKEVTDEEYNEFYTTLTKDSTVPLDKIHFVAEGEITFRAILYIPKKADSKIYDQFYEKSTGLKLYVRRVLISDEFDDFLPRYLNFVKGIVDSDDLPLNVSRETLAQSRVLKVMSKKITRKVLELLRKIADRSQPEDDEDEEGDEVGSTDYEEFWAEYSKSIKMGVMDDAKNKAKLTKLLRYKSSKSNGKWTSFEEYVDRMQEDQEKMYYLTCQDMAGCESNPIMEKFNKKGVEVLYMDDAIDEYCSQHIQEFEGVDPVNAMRESAKLSETAAFKKIKASPETEELISYFKQVLGTKVSKVVVSNKLTTSPAACTAPEYGWTGNMERIMRAQAMQQEKNIEDQTPKKIFEFNPFHPIIKEIDARRQVNEDDEALTDMVNILYDSSVVMAGYNMAEPEVFAKRIHKVISLGLDIDPEASVVEEELEEEEEEAKEEVPEEAEDDESTI